MFSLTSESCRELLGERAAHILKTQLLFCQISNVNTAGPDFSFQSSVDATSGSLMCRWHKYTSVRATDKYHFKSCVRRVAAEHLARASANTRKESLLKTSSHYLRNTASGREIFFILQRSDAAAGGCCFRAGTIYGRLLWQLRVQTTVLWRPRPLTSAPHQLDVTQK